MERDEVMEKQEEPTKSPCDSVSDEECIKRIDCQLPDGTLCPSSLSLRRASGLGRVP